STTGRLQSIQRLVADQLGDALPDFGSNVLHAIPVQAGGLYPISDVWYIEPGLDAPDQLRAHIGQFAREIAEEAGQAQRVDPVDDGVGFVCLLDAQSIDMRSTSWFARAVLTLLHAVSAGYRATSSAPTTLDNLRLADTLGPLLLGRSGDEQESRLSDS